MEKKKPEENNKKRADMLTATFPSNCDASAGWFLHIRCWETPRFDVEHMHEHPLAEKVFVAVIPLLHRAVVAERHWHDNYSSIDWLGSSAVSRSLK